MSSWIRKKESVIFGWISSSNSNNHNLALNARDFRNKLYKGQQAINSDCFSEEGEDCEGNGPQQHEPPNFNEEIPLKRPKDLKKRPCATKSPSISSSSKDSPKISDPADKTPGNVEAAHPHERDSRKQ